jgi:RHS repeat-associated protein
MLEQAKAAPRRNWDAAAQQWQNLPIPPMANATLSTFTRGEKEYFLTDHRGNVMATVSDRKRQVDENHDGIVDYYVTDVVTATDYAPFGAQLPGRTYRSNGKDLRYGYNGKENDNDVKGEGNQIDYGMRIYDPRLGRFLSVDPLTKNYASWSPYPFAMNRPIDGVDLDGLEFLPVNSSMYRMTYLGLAPTLNMVDYKFTYSHTYGVQIVYMNIPEVLQDEEHLDFTFTHGGPVGANGHDQEGVFLSLPGRYNNKGPAFQGGSSTQTEPELSDATKTVGSYYGDETSNRPTTHNKIGNGASAIKEGYGIFTNLFVNMPIWSAMGMETENRSIFYLVTNSINKTISENQNVQWFTKLTEGKGKSDLINFMLDGTLAFDPSNISKLSLEQLTYNLDIFRAGISFLDHAKKNDERFKDIEVGKNFKVIFEQLESAYKRAGGNDSYEDTKKIIR